MARGCAFLAIVTGLVAGVASAAEFDQLGGTAELEARIAALEEQLAEHDARPRTHADSVSYLPAAQAPVASACGPCVGRDFTGGRCRTDGFYGGAEIMWLKPFSSGPDVGIGTSGFLSAASADEFLPGWRLWGGYQNCDGLGWRVNWWQWDQFSTGATTAGGFPPGTPVVPATADMRLAFQKLDLLATQMVSFRRWDVMFLGGVSYAGQTFDYALDAALDNFARTSRFDGWGLTAGTLAYRDIGWWDGLKGYGGVQWSGLYGNAPNSFSTTAGPFPFTDTDAGTSTMLSILELKLGAQYERAIGWGAIGFVSAGFETQYWTGISGTFGDLGFTVGTGIRR